MKEWIKRWYAALTAGVAVVVLIFTGLWFIAGTDYNLCWSGYACGDAGGWLSAIATFAAIVVALRQSHSDELRRVKADVEQRAGIASALMADVEAVAQKCVAAIHELIEDERIPILNFRMRYQFSEYDAMLSMRPSFVGLDYLTVTNLSQMLRLMDNKNKATKIIIERGIDENGDEIGLHHHVRPHKLAHELETYCDILDSCITCIELLGIEVAPKQELARVVARRMSMEWKVTKLKAEQVTAGVRVATA